MLAEFLAVSPALVRAWIKRGWLRASRVEHKLAELDFAEVTIGRQLAALHKGGLSGARLATRLAEIERHFPDVQRPLAELTLVLDGEPVPNDKLRLETITVKDQEHRLALFLLGVRRSESGAPELLVYGQGKEPLIRRPLKPADATQDLPIELTGQENDNETGDLTLHILRKHEATLTLAEQQD